MTATLPYHNAPLTAEERTAIISDLAAVRDMSIGIERFIRSGTPIGFDRFRNDFAQLIDRLAIAFPLPIADEIDE